MRKSKMAVLAKVLLIIVIIIGLYFLIIRCETQSPTKRMLENPQIDWMPQKEKECSVWPLGLEIYKARWIIREGTIQEGKWEKVPFEY